MRNRRSVTIFFFLVLEVLAQVQERWGTGKRVNARGLRGRRIVIIQQADGKIENSDKRTERWTDGRVEDGIDDCGGGRHIPRKMGMG